MGRPGPHTGRPGRSSPQRGIEPSAPAFAPGSCRGRPEPSPAPASRRRMRPPSPEGSLLSRSFMLWVLLLVDEALVDLWALGAVNVTRPLIGMPSLGQPQKVGLLVVTELPLVRGLLHAGQQRRQQVLLLVDQLGPRVVGKFEFIGHGERPSGAGLDAQPAQDAAQVVDLVHAAVALAGRVALIVGVLGALDV